MRPKQYLALRNIFVEFFGTGALVFFSNWANLLYQIKYISVGAYGLTYGMILSLLIYVGLDTSGGHFNPAVTVSLNLKPLGELPLSRPHDLHSRDPVHPGAVPRGLHLGLCHEQAAAPFPAGQPGSDAQGPAAGDPVA